MRRGRGGWYTLKLDVYCQVYLISFDEHELCNLNNDAETALHDAGAISMVFADLTPNTIAHECVHAAMFTFERIGQGVSPADHEAMAYLTGWLVEQVNKALEKENGQKV